MERERVFYSEYCPECGQRACLTQAIDCCDLRICVDAAEGASRCLVVGCCHGCQCQMDQECNDGDDDACGCDCHRDTLLLRLRDTGAAIEVIDLTTSPDPPVVKPSPSAPRIRAAPVDDGPCRCDVCLGRVPLREYTTHGILVSNRPRSCPRFAHGTRKVVSTCYNNEDGRNRRLDEFFTRVNHQRQ